MIERLTDDINNLDQHFKNCLFSQRAAWERIKDYLKDLFYITPMEWKHTLETRNCYERWEYGVWQIVHNTDNDIPYVLRTPSYCGSFMTLKDAIREENLHRRKLAEQLGFREVR